MIQERRIQINYIPQTTLVNSLDSWPDEEVALHNHLPANIIFRYATDPCRH